MKKDARFVGIDDSPFRLSDDAVRLVGVVTRGAQYVEGVLSTTCQVDGDDATEAIGSMVLASRFRPTIQAVLLSGVTFGGFNVLDLDALHDRLGIPVVSVVRSEPRRERTREALEKLFPDAARRLSILDRERPNRVDVGRYELWCSHRGIEPAEVPGLLLQATVRGAVPEPIRLAHLIAGGVARGQSRGPA